MAAEGKKQFKIKMIIPPLKEVKGGKDPDFFAMLPNIFKHLAPIMVQETIEVDPRKWKQKDLEYEVYGMAKPSLQLFAVKLTQMEKKANSQLPPSGGKKRDWASVAKSKAPMDKKVAKEAEENIKKTWQKLVKDIENAISVRLEDIEADKGDNKKAIAGAKEALKKFQAANSPTMFTKPIDELSTALKRMATDLQKSNADKDGASKAALKSIADVDKDVQKTAKSVQQVVKYFLDTGKKMAKDTKSDPAMQKVGKVITGEAKALEALDDAVDGLQQGIDNSRKYAGNTEVKPSTLQELAKEIQSVRGDMEKARNNAIGKVAAIAKEFAAAQKEVKA